MVPAQSSSAESGIRHADDGAEEVGDVARVRHETVDVLLVGKRSTARTLEASLPEDGKVSHANSDLVLDTHFGLDIPIHLLAVTSQRAALLRVNSEPPRAILVEIENRPQSRERFCQVLRARAPAMAILAVCERQPQGAFAFDDFLRQPLSADRTAQAVARLNDGETGQILRCGSLELNRSTRTVYTPDGSRRMTPKLCALLELLMLRHEEVVSRSEIMESIWETSYLDDTRTLDVHVHWLRQSIEPDPANPKYVLTERGRGYSFHCC